MKNTAHRSKVHSTTHTAPRNNEDSNSNCGCYLVYKREEDHRKMVVGLSSSTENSKSVIYYTVGTRDFRIPDSGPKTSLRRKKNENAVVARYDLKKNGILYNYDVAVLHNM